MSKCGKGCMPECEYFTTGGCISPFNCPYKIETGYINSATSIPAYMEQYNGMSDDDIERLKAENAALRERLEKAVELPRVECIMTREWLSRELIGAIMFEWCVLYKKGSYLMAEPCLSKGAAEIRLAELKGEKE